MAYLDSTHFSKQISYETFSVWTYRSQDMIIIRFAKENKQNKRGGLYCRRWDSNLGHLGKERSTATGLDRWLCQMQARNLNEAARVLLTEFFFTRTDSDSRFRGRATARKIGSGAAGSCGRARELQGADARWCSGCQELVLRGQGEQGEAATKTEAYTHGVHGRQQGSESCVGFGMNFELGKEGRKRRLTGRLLM